ncbi:MAG: OmpA family protein [Gammaproteobacteria bacterium]|nr:OmpA family protein [Gammaproteobacteria bacterium]
MKSNLSGGHSPYVSSNRSTPTLNASRMPWLLMPLIFMLMLFSSANASTSSSDWTQLYGEKRLEVVQENADGTFIVDVEIDVQNTGETKVSNIQVVDQLNAIDNFGSAFVGLLGAPSLTVNNNSGQCVVPTINSYYNGTTKAKLFSTLATLFPGDTITTKFRIKLDPHAEGAPDVLQNMAKITGKSSGSGCACDNTGGRSGGPGRPTILDYTKTPEPIESPEIGLQKTFNNTVQLANGNYQTEMFLTVINSGDTDLQNLSLTDALSSASNLGSAYVGLRSPLEYSALNFSTNNPDGSSVAPGLNTLFNGDSVTQVLLQNGLLKPGDSFTIKTLVEFDPNAPNAPGVLQSIARVDGTSIYSTPVFDLSGAANGGPGLASQILLPTVPNKPELTLNKSFGNYQFNSDGTVSFDITLEALNSGTAGLNNLELKDQLNNITNGFGNGFIELVKAPSSNDNLKLNTAFNGTTDEDILLPGNSLSPGQSVSTVYTVRVNPDQLPTPGTLSSTSSSYGYSAIDGSQVFDLSGDVGGGPGEATVYVLEQNDSLGQLTLYKSFQALTYSSDGTFEATIKLDLLNAGPGSVTQVKLIDDLKTNMGVSFVEIVDAPSLIETSNLSAASSLPVANPSYNGSTVLNVIDNGMTLAAGDGFSVAFRAKFNPALAGNPTSLSNTARADGVNANGNTVFDLSGNVGGGPGTASTVATSANNGDPQDDDLECKTHWQTSLTGNGFDAFEDSGDPDKCNPSEGALSSFATGGASSLWLIGFLSLASLVRRKSALVVTLLSVLGVSSVQAGDWYIGGGVGVSKMQPHEGTTGGRVLEDSGTAYRGIVGYNVNRRFAVEGYYADLGKAEVDPGTAAINQGQTGTIGYRAYGVQGLYRVYNTDGYAVAGQSGASVFVKGGVGSASNPTENVSKVIKNKAASLSIGAGAEYLFANGFGVRLDMDAYDKDYAAAYLSGTMRLGGRAQPIMDVPPTITRAPSAQYPVEYDPAPTQYPVVYEPAQPAVSACAAPRAIGRVQFALNSHKLNAEARHALDQVADLLINCPGAEIQVVGNTCAGAWEYNHNLSNHRAFSVARYLVSRGVPADAVALYAMGDKNPIATNDNEAGRAQNRRADLFIRSAH